MIRRGTYMRRTRARPGSGPRGGCDLSRGLVPGPQEGGGGGGGKGGALSTDVGVVVREWGCCDVFGEEAGVCLPAVKQMWTGLWRCLSRRASSRRGLWCRPDSSLDSRGLGDGCCFQLRDFFMPPIDAPWLLGERGVGNFAGACPQKEAVDREAWQGQSTWIGERLGEATLGLGLGRIFPAALNRTISALSSVRGRREGQRFWDPP